MTALIIGLIAALGIGGGIAVANNSGGGGGGSDSGYTEPIQPVERPDIISLLAAADKYQNVQSVVESGQSLPVGNGIFTVTGYKPVVEDGKFKTDSDGYFIEEPYTTTIGLDNYSHSDAYAHYYKKDSVVTKGLLNVKEYPGAPDNWVDMEVAIKDMLALGGQVLGLKNSEFGYHNNIISSSYGESPDYKIFYMYDDTKLASTVRTDTATYNGNVLGSVEAVGKDTGNAEGYNNQALSGKINLNVDFANNILNGNLKTQVENKNWYGFNVTGKLNSVSDFSIDSITIDESQSPDSSLSQYNMSNINGFGNGKLLEDETQKELVGKIGFHGENREYDVAADMSFGAKEVK